MSWWSCTVQANWNRRWMIWYVAFCIEQNTYLIRIYTNMYIYIQNIMIYAYNLHILLYHITSLWQWRSHWPTSRYGLLVGDLPFTFAPFCSLLLPSQMEILLSIQRTLKVLFNTRHIQWTINCRDKIYSNNMYLLYLFIFRLFSEVLTYKIAHSSLDPAPKFLLMFRSMIFTIVLSGTFVVSFGTCWRSHHPIIVLWCFKHADPSHFDGFHHWSNEFSHQKIDGKPRVLSGDATSRTLRLPLQRLHEFLEWCIVMLHPQESWERKIWVYTRKVDIHQQVW